MNPTSELETGFPHIVARLTASWPDVQEYVDGLLIDTRGGRRGFPMDAMSEILFLSDLLWWHAHESNKEAAYTEDFHFGG